MLRAVAAVKAEAMEEGGEEWGKGGKRGAGAGFALKKSHVMVRPASDASGCVKVRCRRRRGMEGVNNTLSVSDANEPYMEAKEPVIEGKEPCNGSKGVNKTRSLT